MIPTAPLVPIADRVTGSREIEYNLEKGGRNLKIHGRQDWWHGDLIGVSNRPALAPSSTTGSCTRVSVTLREVVMAMFVGEWHTRAALYVRM